MTLDDYILLPKTNPQKHSAISSSQKKTSKPGSEDCSVLLHILLHLDIELSWVAGKKKKSSGSNSGG